MAGSERGRVRGSRQGPVSARLALSLDVTVRGGLVLDPLAILVGKLLSPHGGLLPSFRKSTWGGQVLNEDACAAVAKDPSALDFPWRDPARGCTPAPPSNTCTPPLIHVHPCPHICAPFPSYTCTPPLIYVHPSSHIRAPLLSYTCTPLRARQSPRTRQRATSPGATLPGGAPLPLYRGVPR